LKPANIFIMQPRKKSGTVVGDGFVKVGDFGLAKIVGEAVAEADAHSGSGPQSRGIIGTPEYMAPEQMQSGATLDARADVYALGTIAYHMLGGRPPFSGDLAQLIMQKMMNDPPALSSLRSDIQPEVERVVMHALERDPAARSQTVVEWLEEFEEAAGQGAEEEDDEGDSRVVVMAPVGAEVYVDDERRGTVGRSGRLVLTTIAPGRHVLRVARTGDMDDERVIEIRPDSSEQIIQAQLRSAATGSQISPSRAGGASSIGSGPPSSIPGVVVCAQCGSRFASGVKFCGRCGGTTFQAVTDGTSNQQPQQPFQQPQQPSSGNHYGGSPSVYGHAAPTKCQRCGTNYPAGTKFCGRCGIPIPGGTQAVAAAAPRPQQVICQTCRTSYAPGTKFCGRCGSVIRA
jgi:serine/threonine protein kinase